MNEAAIHYLFSAPVCCYIQEYQAQKKQKTNDRHHQVS